MDNGARKALIVNRNDRPGAWLVVLDLNRPTQPAPSGHAVLYRAD